MKTILLISPYWKEDHRWMVSSYKLAELWQRMGYRVVVVCMGENRGKGIRDPFDGAHGKKGKWVEEISDTLTIYWVKDFFLPDPFNYGIAPTLLFHVLRALKIEKPDIVIVNKILFWSSLVTPILRLIGKKPIVLTDALVGITWWPRTIITKIISFVMAWTAGWLVLFSGKRVVFFHPQPSWVLKLLCIKGKSCVIPTGIDEGGYGNKEHPSIRTSTLATLGSRATRDDIIVTYVGRLESVKGVDDFLASVDPLMDQYENLKVQVVGWFKDNHPLLEQYQRRVMFTGLRHDIPEILSETDIFVLPSYSEGLSNALMEAMASGCACIATEVGGNRYLIQNGVSGFLFPSGDQEMLRAHIQRLIDDEPKRESLGKAARERIEKEFSWRVVEKEYANLFADTSILSV